MKKFGNLTKQIMEVEGQLKNLRSNKKFGAELNNILELDALLDKLLDANEVSWKQ